MAFKTNLRDSLELKQIPFNGDIMVILTLLKLIHNTDSTNIKHKGLQRTANEYAEERRIYKDLISKNNSTISVAVFCLQNLICL